MSGSPSPHNRQVFAPAASLIRPWAPRCDAASGNFILLAAGRDGLCSRRIAGTSALRACVDADEGIPAGPVRRQCDGSASSRELLACVHNAVALGAELPSQSTWPPSREDTLIPQPRLKTCTKVAEPRFRGPVPSWDRSVSGEGHGEVHTYAEAIGTPDEHAGSLYLHGQPSPLRPSHPHVMVCGSSLPGSSRV
ncbi:hypothetical protein CDD83_7288 [Cordyceps sp. RAO-2017]|nr:hypothetical protein CDD83_7288 [Cordyceps sp. RAO-2017]